MSQWKSGHLLLPEQQPNKYTAGETRAMAIPGQMLMEIGKGINGAEANKGTVGSQPRHDLQLEQNYLGTVTTSDRKSEENPLCSELCKMEGTESVYL